jgi:hypothetical protein
MITNLREEITRRFTKGMVVGDVPDFLAAEKFHSTLLIAHASMTIVPKI